jgi:signal peptidase I
MPDEHIADQKGEGDLAGGAGLPTAPIDNAATTQFDNAATAQFGAADDTTAGGTPVDGGPIGGTPADGQPTAAAGEPGHGKKKQKKKKSFAREMLTIVVAAILLTMLIKIFVIQVYEIPSPSMENTLMVGDRVLVNKLIYHFRGIARGDIIVFSGAGSWGDLNGNPIPPPPSNPIERGWDDVLGALGLRSDTTYYIKRVIGLPGDHIYCNGTGGPLEVNGVPLNESSYLIPGAQPSSIPINVTVPAGRLYVLGDNRPESEDSRYHDDDGYSGTIPENEVTGRAFLIIWPLSQFKDLPIPSTFNQAGLHTSAIGRMTTDVTAATLDAGPAGWVGALALPVLAWRWKRHRARR